MRIDVRGVDENKAKSLLIFLLFLKHLLKRIMLYLILKKLLISYKTLLFSQHFFDFFD